MLELINNSIVESGTFTTSGGCVPATTSGGAYDLVWRPYQTIYWHDYPVYVTTDKTKKAIEVLKALQAEKLLDCKSVPRFIELVEKIAGIL